MYGICICITKNITFINNANHFLMFHDNSASIFTLKYQTLHIIITLCTLNTASFQNKNILSLTRSFTVLTWLHHSITWTIISTLYFTHLFGKASRCAFEACRGLILEGLNSMAGLSFRAFGMNCILSVINSRSFLTQFCLVSRSLALRMIL